MSSQVELLKSQSFMQNSFSSCATSSLFDSNYAVDDDVSRSSSKSNNTATLVNEPATPGVAVQCETNDCNWLYRLRRSREAGHPSLGSAVLVTWMRDALPPPPKRYNLEEVLLQYKQLQIVQPPATLQRPKKQLWNSNGKQSIFHNQMISRDEQLARSACCQTDSTIQPSLSMDNVASRHNASGPLGDIIELARQQEANLKAHMLQRERSHSGSRHSSVNERAVAQFYRAAVRDRTRSRNRNDEMRIEWQSSNGDVRLQPSLTTTPHSSQEALAFERIGTFRKGRLMNPLRAPYIAGLMASPKPPPSRSQTMLVKNTPPSPSSGLPRPFPRYQPQRP